MIHTNSGLHIGTCKYFFNLIYGLQEKCKKYGDAFSKSSSIHIYILTERCQFL